MSDSPSDAEVAPQIRVLLISVFLAYMGQMTLNPIIAPLAREVGLAEWHIGVTISMAAVMVVVTSQFWGRRSQSWGRKPVLVAALGLAAASMALFAGVAQLGIAGVVTGTTLFLAFVLLRGIGFGAAIAAVPPTAQAYIADVTHDEATRVKGMAGVGAVQGVAMVAGAVAGGALSAIGMMAPLIVVPILLAGGLALVVLRLHRQPAASLVRHPARIRPTDTRVWPFLLAGFGMLTALGFIQIVTGFLVQDRLGLGPEETGLVTGGALLAAGLGMIVAQGLIVPRSGWTPPTLLRVGSLVAVAGFAVLIPDAGWLPLIGSILLIGLGLGIAMPGYTAGPTLLMRRTSRAAWPGSSAPPTASPSSSHPPRAPRCTACGRSCRSSSAPP
ncbi:MAG: MFS transporter [Micropruina sp.]